MRFVLWIILITLHFGIGQANAQKVIHDANAQVRQVGSFTGVEISSAIDLVITQSAQTAVAISASSDNDVALIKTEVKNNILHIYYDSKSFNWGGSKKMRAYVSAPVINLIRASGACNVRVDGSIKNADLSISLSGASDFKGTVNTQNLRLGASGASDIAINGKSAHAKIDVSGSSDIMGFELTVDYADIEASGASDVNITVEKELKVNASGSSDVHYKGNGSVRSANTSGSSDVKKKS